MRYLACGSEDTAVHLYDLRQGTLLQKVRVEGPGAEVVLDVAFHPALPQLVAGCMDGRVRFYSDIM